MSMLHDPLLHTIVEAKLRTALKYPPHAILLAGTVGSGKATVAKWLAAELLSIPVTKLETHPYYTAITAESGKAIGIEAVRQLEHIISLRIPGNHTVNRVVVITDAHLLTTEAQNALLKTLEEPPAGTVLILTSSQQEALLPTIQSRMQSIEVTAPSPEKLLEMLKSQGVSSAAATRIMALSGGLPGLAFALAADDREHPLVAAAITARELLQQSAFEKLCKVDSLSKDKEAGRNVIRILMQMAHAALLTGKGSDRWQRVLQAAYDADIAIARGTQPKLALTNLMLSI